MSAQVTGFLPLMRGILIEFPAFDFSHSPVPDFLDNSGMNQKMGDSNSLSKEMKKKM